MKNVEDIYPLSPMQEGMLLHSVLGTAGDLYLRQLSCRLRGGLDTALFEQAWQQTVERHTILRTGFLWQGLEKPLQVVRRRVRLSFAQEDWRRLPAPEQKRALATYLAADRERGLDLARAPLLRLALCRSSDHDYLLVWTFHHLLLDGWSRGLLMQEVLAVYRALCRGETPELPPARPFRDFIAWLGRRDEQGAEQKVAERFWRQRLAGFTAPTEVGSTPTESGSDVERSAMAEHRCALSAAKTRALETLSRRHGLTLGTVIHGAWGRVLARHGGSRDVVFGSVVLGRSGDLADLESRLGMLINTLPLRLAVTPDAELIPWLRDLQTAISELNERAYDSLAEVQAWSEVPPGSPLFESIVVFQPHLAPHLDSGDLEISEVALEREATTYPLSLTVTPGGELALQLVFDRKRLSGPAASRLLEHCRVVLEGMVESLEGRLGELPVLTVGERHQLLREWSDTVQVPQAWTSTLQQFEAQADRRPHQTAVTFEGASLTYSELDRRAGRLAHRLRDLDVGPELLVGLAVEPGLELPVALLGIWKVGAAYVPLDPAFPKARLHHMVQDSGLSVMVIGDGVEDRLPPFAGPLIVLAGDDEGEHRLRPEVDVPAEALAYVLYTSGSTGLPKGVQISHGALANFLAAMHCRPGLGAGDRVLAVTSLSFDISVLELVLPLVAGAEVELVSRATAADGERLRKGLSGKTLVQATPATWRLLLAAGWTGEAGCRVLCGGEALPVALAAELTARAPAVWNMYGPTETTIWSSVEEINAAPAGSPVSIGRPIANTRLHVVGTALDLQPLGVPGELLIGGAGLARGYRRRPALTAERFVPDSFSPRPGERLYRTGDQATWLEDGRLVTSGRLDHQVKLRGFRIELGEIEAQLTLDPAVAAAAVRLWGEGEAARLVAYVVLAAADAGADPGSGAALDAELEASLRRHLQRTLPDHMLPSVLMTLDALPLTPNRKVDCKALPAPGAERYAGPASSEPATPLEKQLAAIWGEVLSLDRIGAEDHFFELGGHSLLAFRMIARVRQELGVDLPMRTVFAAPRLRALADRLQLLVHAVADGAMPGLPEIEPRPADRHQSFPLTEVQEAYWVGRRSVIELGSVATHGYAEIDFRGLDPKRLNLAWRRLIERHDMLRAIVLPDGRQQILPEVEPYEAQVLDLRDDDEATTARRLEAVRAEMSHQVLATDRWPLFDIRMSCFGDGRVRLHLSIDALIRDAWSNQILWRELTLLYRDPDAALPPLTLSFRDCVLAMVALRNSDLYTRDLEYWRGRELPPRPDLPLARDPTAVDKPRFVRRSVTLPVARWQRLQERASRAGLTPSGVLLAAYAEVLACWSKSPRFTLTLTLFNRLPLHPQIHDVVGDFTSVTLLEVDRSTSEGFERRSRRLQQRLWEDLDHRLVSGIHLLRELSRARGGSREALMPVVFTSALGGAGGGFGQAGSQAPGEPGDAAAAFATAKRGYVITQTPQVWLDYQVSEQDGQLVCTWDAVEELFPEGLLDDMFQAHDRLLRALADDEAAWGETGRVLVPAPQLEQRAVINATAPSADHRSQSQVLIHQPFEAQARRHPERPAVLTSSKTVTYGELLNASMILGSRLGALGARPNRLVAVVMDKGWEQLAAVLGVLRSGAAYLPIDPGLPRERLEFLLQHGEVGIVLTRADSRRPFEWPAGLIVVTVGDDLLQGRSDSELAEAAEQAVQQPDDLAYVIFTSGSTGKPKGVMIDHRGAMNTLVDVNRRFDVGPQDRVLALSELSFDLSVYDVFGILAVGAALVIPDPGRKRDPAHWAKLMNHHQVSVWNTVPALMEMLVESDLPPGEMPDSTRRVQAFASLRLVLLSGDWVPVTLPDRIRSLAGKAVDPATGEALEIVSLGGATEASIWSVLYPIGDVPASWTSIPYGRPMVDQSLQILDRSLEPRPVWTPGDLYIGGVGVAKGYWRDAEKTAASFIVHPVTGERLYRTGDLARYLPSGDVEFLGREDFQVKIRGHRIELGEIETALLRADGVRAAVALAMGERSRRRLVAFVVVDDARPDAAVVTPWLQDHLRHLLPHYMVPATFVELEELPLTANGKVDRGALEKLETAAEPASEAVADEEPASEMERLIAEAWQEILGCVSVGRRQNFFQLGGVSISAIKLINLLRSRFELDLPLDAVFEAPTVAELAELVAVSLSEGIDEAELQEALAGLDDLSEEELLVLGAVGDG